MENSEVANAFPYPIAILGANSVIAQGFLDCTSISQTKFLGFVRNPKRFTTSQVKLLDYGAFPSAGPFSAILNFVGYGSPARAEAEKNSILEVTRKFDLLALDYLNVNPWTPYIFISSGSVYNLTDKYGDRLAQGGSDIDFSDNESYPYAKFEAEYRHRRESGLDIVDIRVFNHVSDRQSKDDGFLFTDIIKALAAGEVLVTKPEDNTRDYASKANVAALIEKALEAPRNMSLDLFTKSPISKFDLLEHLSQEFGLQVRVDSSMSLANPTGEKNVYTPRSFLAVDFGYEPGETSLENVIQAVTAFRHKLQF